MRRMLIDRQQICPVVALKLDSTQAVYVADLVHSLCCYFTSSMLMITHIILIM